MANITDSLWPQQLQNNSIPRPIEILKNQGTILSQATGGQLYTELVQSLLHTTDSVVYDFYVCVTGKSFRHKMLTIECNILKDYPAVIINHAAGSTVQVHTEQEYLDNLKLILGSTVTTDLVGRLWALARD